MQYTIKNVTASGKEDPKFGIEYLVNFNEDSRTVRMNRKYPPRIGSVLIGEVLESRYGAYFKRDPEASTPTQSTLPTTSPTTSTPKSSSSPRTGDRNYTMFVSYAKDLMIAYMGSIDWDYKKFDYGAFGEMLSVLSTTAHTLQDSESDEAPSLEVD
jgi:hypothetical protein